MDELNLVLAETSSRRYSVPRFSGNGEILKDSLVMIDDDGTLTAFHLKTSKYDLPLNEGKPGQVMRLNNTGNLVFEDLPLYKTKPYGGVYFDTFTITTDKDKPLTINGNTTNFEINIDILGDNVQITPQKDGEGTLMAKFQLRSRKTNKLEFYFRINDIDIMSSRTTMTLRKNTTTQVTVMTLIRYKTGDRLTMTINSNISEDISFENGLFILN